jgi:hypothetical protein
MLLYEEAAAAHCAKVVQKLCKNPYKTRAKPVQKPVLNPSMQKPCKTHAKAVQKPS